jgi:hypothetical protein
MLAHLPLPEVGYEQPLNGFIVTMLSTVAWSFVVVLVGAILGSLGPSRGPRPRD